MNEENRNVPELEKKQEKQKKTRKRTGWGKWLFMVCLCAMMMVPSAFATETSGLEAVLAQSTNATTLIGAAFDLITGNAYLALLCFFGLLGVAIRLFRRGKRAAR